MKKTTILVLADPSEPQLAMLDELRDSADVVVGNTSGAFRGASVESEVILKWSGSVCVLREVFLMFHHLRWVHSRSVGLERTLFPELVASNITLTNGRSVFSPSLGEFVLAAILYFAKDFRRMMRNQTASVWEPYDVTQVAGQTVGIVGYGDVGRAIAASVRAVGLKVLAIKRHIPADQNSDPLVSEIYTPKHLIEILPRCDYVVVAAPLSAETRGLLGPAEFAAMKTTAVVINVGRGPIIDERTLIRALSNREIKGAALDVFDQEPLPKGHPFYNLQNVLLSPHCADHAPDWLDNAMRFFITQFRRFRAGHPLLSIVNKNLGY
jgi:phosphoglycerate dehydrogenase-like enzyme